MRRVPLLLVLLFIVFSLGDYTAYAEEIPVETKTQLQVTASIQDGFDNAILISLTSQDQTNVISRLDKGNGYKVVQEILAGTYQVGFINIVGGNVTDYYNIEVADKLEIVEGKVTELPLKLVLKIIVQNQDTSVGKLTSVSDTESIVNSATTSIPNVIGDTKHSIESLESTVNSELPPMTSERTAITKVSLPEIQVKVIIGLAILGLITLLWYLYRQISYKHDYYDC